MQGQDIFDAEQLELIRKIGIGYDLTKELTIDESADMSARICDYLLARGLDAKGNGVNKAGKLCESILDTMCDNDI